MPNSWWWPHYPIYCFTSQSLYFLRKHRWVGSEGGPRGRGYMYTYIADSLHCTAETNSYTPTERKKKESINWMTLLHKKSTHRTPISSTDNSLHKSVIFLVCLLSTFRYFSQCPDWQKPNSSSAKLLGPCLNDGEKCKNKLNLWNSMGTKKYLGRKKTTDLYQFF